MALSWVNYLSAVVGVTAVISSVIIAFIVLRRNPKEKLNWLFSFSFFFIAIAYFFLPIGGFIYTDETANVMVFLTKIYCLSLFLGVVFLALSALAFNYGTQFIARWHIILLVLISIGVVAGTLFGFNNPDGLYSIRQAPTGGADTQTSLTFTLIFYPVCLIFVIVTVVFFIRALGQTEDKNVRKSLKYFIGGICTNVAALIPNILSNVLAEYWANAQMLNGLEFIMDAIGMTLMLIGFVVKPTPPKIEVVEESYQVPVS